MTAPIHVPRLERERAVVELLGRGELTRSALNREICRTLGCSDEAVWGAVRWLMRRVVVGRRGQTRRLFLTPGGRFAQERAA